MTTATLSFGDTFTLPSTGEHEWTIRDLRPAFAHLGRPTGWTASARNTVTHESAFYSPAGGWHVHPYERHADIIVRELDQLSVHLPSKTDTEYSDEYRRMLTRETANEVGDITGLVKTWTNGTSIDQADLRAHVAAVAVLVAVGIDPKNPGSPGVNLYESVREAALAAIEELAS